MAVASAEEANPAGQSLSAAEAGGNIPATVSNNFPIEGDANPEGNIISQRFSGLSRTRQLQLVLSVAATIAMIVVLFLWSSEPNYKLVYGKLTEKSAAEIAGVLDQEGYKYKFDSSTGELKVPAADIHNVRLKLAAQGLPKSDGNGFEVLDQQQSFGTSQFMEKARYHRALEGELGRTVASFTAIESARVHLAIPKRSVFIRHKEDPSASVMVLLIPGKMLDENQVQSIVHMVASSIPDLKPGKVTVVDQRGKLLSKKELSGDMAMSTAQFDYKRNLEEYYIERIERILMPIVGFEGVRAEVDTQIDFTSIEKTQESFNPDLPALRSEQTSSEQSNGGDAGSIPGALTNQPPGVATAPQTMTRAGKEASSGPSRSSRQETFNYELDKTISHSKQAPGTLRRLSVAVVVDDRTSYDTDGNMVRTALVPEEIQQMTDLIRDAVGYSAARGDSVNVINASFINSAAIPEKPAGPIWVQNWFIDIAKQAVGVIFILLVIALFLRPVIRELTYKVPEVMEIEEKTIEEQVVEEDVTTQGGLSRVQWEELGISFDEFEDMLSQLKDLAAGDPRIVAQVIKTWVTLDDEM